jgi:hypothetical protein
MVEYLDSLFKMLNYKELYYFAHGN